MGQTGSRDFFLNVRGVSLHTNENDPKQERDNGKQRRVTEEVESRWNQVHMWMDQPEAELGWYNEANGRGTEYMGAFAGRWVGKYSVGTAELIF